MGMTQDLNGIKTRVANVLHDYQLREKGLVAKCKSLEFEVKTLKEIIREMKGNPTQTKS